MRIYHRRGAATISAGGVTYQAAPDGGFEGLPPEVETHLLGFPDWETDVQREQRRVREDLARRRDPASQFDEIAAMRAEMRADLRGGGPVGQAAEIAELRARLAALEGTPAPAAPVKATRARRAAAAGS